MDPNANLKEQLEIAKAIWDAWEDDQPFPEQEGRRLAELVLALDEWIKGGGFLPEQWRKDK